MAVVCSGAHCCYPSTVGRETIRGSAIIQKIINKYFYIPLLNITEGLPCFTSGL